MLSLATSFYCQVGIGTINPSPASRLDVSSTSDEGLTYKGLMPPRVPNKTEMNNMATTPSDVGLLIFLESTKCLMIWSGTEWLVVSCTEVIWPAVQNFDTTPAAFELPLFSETNGYYTSGNNVPDGRPNSALYAAGDRGYGVSNRAATVILGPIDVSSTSTAIFKLRLAAFSKNKFNGMEDTDTVLISFSTNGTSGPFSDQMLIHGGPDGSSNYTWDFDATGTATVTYDSGGVATEFTSVDGSAGTTYLEINGIPNSNDLAIKIELINNAKQEIWVIDEAEIWGN